MEFIYYVSNNPKSGYRVELQKQISIITAVLAVYYHPYLRIIC